MSTPICWCERWADDMAGAGHIDLSVMAPGTAPQAETLAVAEGNAAGKYDGSWSVFNSGGACIIENVTFGVAADYMTPYRFARGWTMVSVINTQANLEAEESRATPVAQAAAEPVKLDEPDEEMCEKLAALGWQKVVCGMCGHDGARGYPRRAAPVASGAGGEAVRVRILQGDCRAVLALKGTK